MFITIVNNNNKNKNLKYEYIIIITCGISVLLEMFFRSFNWLSGINLLVKHSLLN